MKWQIHTTKDKTRESTLSIAEQLYTDQLIVRLEQWDVKTEKLITFGTIIIDQHKLVDMVQSAKGVK